MSPWAKALPAGGGGLLITRMCLSNNGAFRLIIFMGLVIPPKSAVSSIEGKMKANLSWQLRLRYLELKQTYWGAVLWSPGFFSSTGGWNEAVIRRYVEHQERVDKGPLQLKFEF